MKTAVLTAFVGVAAALVIVFGCDTGIGQGTADTSALPGAGFLQIDSYFSDAPPSPAGTADDVVEEPDVVDLPAEETRSFFTAFQIDPVEEDTAGPKFVVSADIDQDGLLDLVSAWNQSQPVQLHLQRRDPEGTISFRTITLGGTTPIAVVAGLQVGQINDDGWLDVVVLVKADGTAGLCPPNPCESSGDCAGDMLCIDGCCAGNCDAREVSRLQGQIILYFSPGNASLIPDGDTWDQTILINPLVVDKAGNQWGNQFPGIEFVGFDESKTKPEWSGFTSLVVANIDAKFGDDIVVTLNRAPCDSLGQDPPSNTVDLWVNPGAGLSENPTGWGAPLTIMGGVGPQVKDAAVMDIDGDGDLDVIATFTDAISRNIRWARNPVNATGSVAGGWEQRPIGQVDTGADIIALGDVDNDGSEDVIVRSTVGQIVQWFRRPNALVVPPEFPPNDPVPDRFNFPWPVFTLTEFSGQEPEAIALGDVTGDGRNELMVAVGGGVFWYDATVGASVFDPWFPNAIIQDTPTDTTDATAGASGGGGSAPDAGVESVDVSTHINALLVVDLDGDGRNDIVGTLDRRTGSGLSDDRLVWYRNTRAEDEGE
jgi:hypothetical protein